MAGLGFLQNQLGGMECYYTWKGCMFNELVQQACVEWLGARGAGGLCAGVVYLSIILNGGNS